MLTARHPAFRLTQVKQASILDCSLCLRYRKAALGDERELVVRCAVDAVMHLKGQEQLVSIKALNEFDPKCAPCKTCWPCDVDAIFMLSVQRLHNSC